MKPILKRIGYGVILWAVPYGASIPLLPVMESSPMTFKALMVFIGSIVGAVLAVYYFLSVEENYLRESVVLACTWLVVNWALDFVALLPFSHQTLPQYFMEIGIEYIGFMAFVIGIGYLLEKKCGFKK